MNSLLITIIIIITITYYCYIIEAMTRNPRKMLRVKSTETNKQFISIYTSSGRLLSKFEWNAQARGGTIVHMSWSSDENLVVVSEYVFQTSCVCIL